MDEPHPNGIDEGYTRTGYTDGLPTVGKELIIVGPGMRVFHTSIVKDVTVNTFTTENSIYSYKILEL